MSRSPAPTPTRDARPPPSGPPRRGAKAPPRPRAGGGGAKAGGRGPPGPEPASRILSLRRVVVTALFAGAILAGAILGVFLAFESDLPQVTSLEDFQPNIITQVLGADGSPLGEFAIEKRVVVAFRDIPPVPRHPIVAVEDAGFWG